MRAAPGGRHHGAVEPAPRREDARRVDEHELRGARDRDAAHQRARGLHLAGDDRDLGADQRVDERRLAGVRRADQRDEAAARRRTSGRFSRRHRPPRPSRVSIAAAAACSAARLERPIPSAGSRSAHRHRDAEFRIVVRAGALHLAIGRRRQAAPLRPFLQHGLGIAQRRAAASACARATAARSSRPPPDSRRREHRADQRLAHVGEDRGAAPPAGIGSPNCRAAIAAPRSIARATSAQVSRRTRSASRRDSSPSSPRGKARNSMSEIDEPEHVVAEEFEPLVAAAAPLLRRGGRDMGQRALEDRLVGERVADPAFELARGAFALRLIERSRTTGSSAPPRASARPSRRPRRRRPRRR